MAPDRDPDRQRRVRRTAIFLALIALAFYVGYIVLSMVNASHALHGGNAPPPPAQAPR